jgi:hypothetical protein
MKVKNSTLLIITFLIVALAAYFIYKRKDSTIDNTKISFAVFDPSQIKKIVITEPDKKVASLVKSESGDWMINERYKCRNDNMKSLLQAIEKVRIKYPVPNAAVNNVLKDIATIGIKVEIFNNENELIKAYYLGRETADMGGNNALLINTDTKEPYEAPIVIEIPGFNGYVSPRFFANEYAWRDVDVFKSQINELKKIEVKYNAHLDSSFIIENLGNNLFDLKKWNGEKVLQFDSTALKRYLIYYRQAAVFAFIPEKNDRFPRMDSIAKSTPFAEVSITTTNKPIQRFEFFRQPVLAKEFATTDTSRRYDPESVLMRLNEPKEFAVAQYTNIGKWLQTWAYFAPQRPVKN